jgi:hypothetical protein
MSDFGYLDPIISGLSGILNIPMAWFGFPQIIFYVFIPAAALIFMWYSLLNKKLRFFKSGPVNLGISIMIGIPSVWAVEWLGPILTTGIAVCASILVMGSFTVKRIVAAVAVTLGVYFLLAFIIAALQANI